MFASKFTELKFDGFNSQPSWSGTAIFDKWKADGGTVISTGSWSSSSALTYAINKKLPGTWTAS
jgi:hypothetical protein